ncbi:lipopolysaccharide kinase InaA family protein [Winogradskyella aurantia]|uniref:Kdo domain containing protein n=1 Tax=Winogradskyella aurantia TaxID=1915063 RepID=A0A265UXL3_9FLAO|nr:lipopolysaccharide kinase InaA family protein [Winogradskyella aurantia]OZV70041.1 hypothetical protein CA834_05330 [Winogradskyella aurantia]
MRANIVINTDSKLAKEDVLHILERFANEGKLIGDGNRNVIKVLEVNGEQLNIKSFKIPNIINQVAYRFFRKSKAQRSFEYAYKLSELDIKTPQPVAYVEYTSGTTFKRSYYISKQIQYDLTFHDLLLNRNLPDYESIMREFTRFTFQLHEKGIHFLDHSPGNTLIRVNDDDFEFFLVDLNRMEFKILDFNERMKNFARLSPRDHMLDIMSNEYSKLYPLKSEAEIKEKMYFYSHQFMTSFAKREAFKKKYFFWRAKKS